MVQTAETIFRDFETDGVPASGTHKPKKSEIRQWGTRLESLYSAAQAGGGLAYETKAAMDADLAHAANQIAWVMEDPTAANNGIYQKVGVSGSGSWNRLGDLPYSYIKASNAGAGTANAIVATTSIPIPAADGGALIALPIVADNTASPVTVSFNGGAALMIKTSSGNDVPVGGLKPGGVAGFKIGSTFVLLSDVASASIQAAAEAAADRAEAAAASIDYLTVADRTALKAVDTATHTSVYLRSIGRQANFIADDMSAFVAIDTQEILYVAPASDPTGASGAWVVQHDSWSFDLEWAKDFSGDGVADDTTAIKGAVSLAEFLGVGTEIRLPNKVSLISEKIAITSGVRIVARHGLGNAATGVPTAMVARWIWDSAVAGDTMVEVKATTTGEVVNYFAMLGLTLDANNTATDCLIMSSVAFFELDFVTFRPVNNGCRINDANGALSNGGTIKRYYHFCGSDPAAWNSNGLFIDGDVTGSYCTSIKAEYIECEFVNGHALTIRATDSVSIDRFKPYLRSGSGGTGFALRYLKSTFGTPTFHAQKNLIKHMFGAGNIYVGDYCKGNIIDILTSESGYIIYESSGANKRVLHINHLQDFRFSDAWATKKWALDDQVIVPLPECITYGATAPTSETAGAIACGRAFTFADAVQAGIGWAGPIPPDWNDGFITGIKLTLCTKGAAAGNVGFRVQFNAADVGSGVGGFTVDQTFVLTPSASANTLSEHVCTFTAEQAVSLDGYMFLAIERLGGGGTDTYAASIQIIGIEIQYRGEGPDSGATYGPYPQFLDIDPANP